MKYTDKQVRKMVFDYLKEDYDNAKDLSKSCYYSIIEDYVPDCPGWTGDILTVVFGFHSAIDNFSIDNNKLRKIIPEN